MPAGVSVDMLRSIPDREQRLLLLQPVAADRVHEMGTRTNPHLVPEHGRPQPAGVIADTDFGVTGAHDVRAVAIAVHPRIDDLCRRGLPPGDVLAPAAGIARLGQALTGPFAVGIRMTEEIAVEHVKRVFAGCATQG